jgi:hypothetical protein
MPDWIGLTTRVLGPFGQRLLKRWLFEAELLGAARTVYTFESGDSPYVSIGATVRVHNRNSVPTTLHVRSVAVKLPNRTERALERAVMVRPGPVRSMDDMAGFNSYELLGCSSVELTLSTRVWNPPNLDDYLENGSPQIVLELGETFGNHRKLVGQLKFQGVYEQ